MRRHLGIDRWTFWDGSAGGAIALLYALAYPDAPNGLIAEMVGPNGRGIAEDPTSILNPLHPQYTGLLATPAAERRPAVLAEVVPALAGAYWRPLGTENWVLVQHERPIIVSGGSEPNERRWAGFEQWMTVLNVENRLGEIQMPTLIVAGRQDAFMPLEHVAQPPAGSQAPTSSCSTTPATASNQAAPTLSSTSQW